VSESLNNSSCTVGYLEHSRDSKKRNGNKNIAGVKIGTIALKRVCEGCCESATNAESLHGRSFVGAAAIKSFMNNDRIRIS
jgi:hypothetical protein